MAGGTPGRGSAPAQINVPRDFWTQVIDIELPQIIRLERPAGGEEAVAQAALAGARTTEHNDFKRPLVERTLASLYRQQEARA